MGLWAKSLRIFNSFCDNAQQRIRHVAHQTGRSKSRVHRLKQAMARRDTHPESWWWETDEGHSTRQTSAEVERQWHTETRAIEAFIATSGLPVTQKALDKVRTQLAGVAALVDVWWQGVWHD